MDLSDLKRWVNINSGSTNLEGLGLMAEVLSEALKEIDGELEQIRPPAIETPFGDLHQSGDVLRLRFRKEASLKVLFSGHMDTVYGPDHPFQQWVELESNKATGPGIADMKGGLFIMINALKRFLKEDSEGIIGGEVLINADEELGSLGSQDILRQSAKANDIGLVFESALPGGELVRCRNGTGNFKLTVTGKAAHTGRDFQNGRNAIAALSKILAKCHDLNGAIDGVIINVANFNSPGPVNVVPDHAEAWLNIRVSRPDAVDGVLNAIRETINQLQSSEPGISVDLRGEFLRMPKMESTGNALLHKLWNKVESELGMPISGKRDTGGSSDGNIFGSEALPHLDGVGIMGGDIHSSREWAMLDSIPRQISKTVAFLHYLSANHKTVKDLRGE